MTRVFSNKSSIYCIIRQQYFNKLVPEKLPDFN